MRSPHLHARTSSPEEDRETIPFGQQLHEELRRAGWMSLLTRRLEYAEIRELERADRAGVAGLFPSAPCALRQRFKTQSLEQIVEALVRELETSETAVLLLLFAIT